MSLFVDEGRRRGRSKSPGRRKKDREDDDNDKPEYGAPVIMEAREPRFEYPEDDDHADEYEGKSSRRRKDDRDDHRRKDDGYRASKHEPRASGALPYPGGGGMPYPGSFPDDDAGVMMPAAGGYDYDRGPPKGSHRNASPPPESPYRSSKDKHDKYDRYDEERSRRNKDRDDTEEKLKYLPQKYSQGGSKDYGRKKYDDSDSDDDRRRPHYRDVSPPSPKKSKKEKYEADLAYGSPPGYGSFKQPDPRDYGARMTDEDLPSRYRYREDSPDRRDPRRESANYLSASGKQPYGRAYEDDPRKSAPNVLMVDPNSRNRERSSDRRGGSRRDKSPQPPVGKMSSLTVNTGHHALNMSLSHAPPSPLLEAYHGTYQSCSPMPSPILLPSHAGSDLPSVVDVAPLDSDSDREDGKKKRRARFHDKEDIATRLAKALKGDRRAPDKEPLIEILPSLTHEQIMELRREYKAMVKTGPDRRGVNVAKHIRARLKDEDPSLMKACYAVALGKWESEAYWANFWYQGDKTRRELLLEALMGRTNDEIREIKDGFNDKKYDNSLTKCMKTELKEDKFKKAVLMVLEERRMEDVDQYGRPLPIDHDLVDQDVENLRKAVKSEKGGESLMISIVVQRSDAHLKEILRTYNKAYGSNFARDALKRSGNLVGELLAHILNGVINKPVRDALLINHALTASKKDALRRELLISRLVRFHWDRHHMERIKKAYRDRYGKDLQEAVREGTSGDWGLFCRELCIARMPDDVRRVERIDVLKRERDRDRDRERHRDRDRD